MTETLGDLGEAELLKRLARFAPDGQLSDDTASLRSDSRPLLVNSDVLVDGVHFSDATTSAADVGWRAVAANLSDLAASGAVAIDGITVTLVAPSTTPWSWVEELYTGIADGLSEFGGTLLGGDCSAGLQKLVSITALGRLGPLRLHRGEARPGDWIVTSGAHGLSRLGLALLQNDEVLNTADLNPQLRALAIATHQRPIPRLDALDTLLACKPDGLAWRAGGTDSSDGLLAAVEALCRSSGCGAELTQAWLPRTQHWPFGDPWDQWCLAGGEDFELVLSLPPAWAQRWLEKQAGSRRIGRITGESSTIRWSENAQPVQTKGFHHFRNN